MVGKNKKVLEIGPASGYVTRALRRWGCNVTCIEIDGKAASIARKYSHRMIRGDVETLDLRKTLGKEKYDVVLLGDVLEHLKDPGSVLRRLQRYLKPAGYVVATLPNIAHGSVRLLLLDGILDTKRTGILDSTHLHFYTRKTILQLFGNSGYSIQFVKEIRARISAAENLQLDLKKYPPDLIRAVEADPDATVHEFALIAKPERVRLSKRNLRRHGELVTQGLQPETDAVTREIRRFLEQRQTMAEELSAKSQISRLLESLERLLALYSRRLLRWARDWLATGRDGSSSTLLSYAEFYKGNEWVKLANDLDQAKASVARHESTIQSLQDQVQFRDSELRRLEGGTQTKDSELVEELRTAVSERDSLSTKLQYATLELDTVKNSFGYRFIQFYSKRIDRALPEGTRRGEFRKIVVESLRIASTHGIRKLLGLALEKIKRREFYVIPTVPRVSIIESPLEGLLQITETDYSRPVELISQDVELKPLGASVSVIILTKSPPNDFEQTLERLRGQKGVVGQEILVVNSGGCDLRSLAKKYGVKEYGILPEEFEHAATRNYAAEKITGDYVVFMADDAVPATEHLLHDMTKIIESSRTVGAVTARQIPRSDADMMYCQAIWGHYRMLGLDRDRIVGSSRLEDLTPQQKRAICQIDDVCSCFRTDVFLKYKFVKGLGYAEDLELGIRMVKDGLQVAQLFSAGVIHSHNRPPSYYLRRSYVDYKVLSKLLDYQVPEFKSWPVESWNGLIDLILRLIGSLDFTVDALLACRLCDYNISKAFERIRKSIRKDFGLRGDTKTHNEDLLQILQRIKTISGYRPGSEALSRGNLLAERYLISLGTLEEWLSKSHQDLSSVEAQFFDTLYKMCAVEIGHALGEFMAYGTDAGSHEEKVSELDRFLSEGV
jgi:SAM-dependent methyltransferase/glycosyltransferase involved in cell wall biosynthesis